MDKTILIFFIGIFTIAMISGACTSDWQCTEWSECFDGNQIRSCIDFNNCQDLSSKPEESRACTPNCIPKWECSEWLPEICPETETFSRNCEDINRCGILDRKPEETKFCEYKKDYGVLFPIGITIIIFLILLTIIILYELLKKRTKHKRSLKLENLYK